MEGYIERSERPGRFLTAVLCDQLFPAVEYAVDTDLEFLPDLVRWIQMEAPPGCWGSMEYLEEWISRRAGSPILNERVRQRRVVLTPSK